MEENAESIDVWAKGGSTFPAVGRCCVAGPEWAQAFRNGNINLMKLKANHGAFPRKQ